MEHIFFEVQLCIKISIFKEKHVFLYTDHPTFSRKPGHVQQQMKTQTCKNIQHGEQQKMC